MKPRHAFLFLYLFFVPPCFAQNLLPDKPQPQPAGHVADREFWIDAGALGAAWTADTISTHYAFAAAPNHMEGGFIFHNSRSVPKIMGAWAAVDVGAVVASYEWKQHVHNRYLHPLWRVPLFVGIIGHDTSAIQNLTGQTGPR